MTDNPLSAYDRWKLRQQCFNCGRRFMDRPKDGSGNYLDMWATETQCMACLKAFGPPERQYEL